MGHLNPELLTDLKKELDVIRKLEGLKEKSLGIFYLKSASFLHFHDKDGRRWADVKTLSGWLSVDIDFKAGAKEKVSFVRAVKKAYLEMTEKKARAHH